jgi:hypothetical protein
MSRLRLHQPTPPVVYAWIDARILAGLAALLCILAAAAFWAHALVATEERTEPDTVAVTLGERQLTLQRAWLLGAAAQGDRKRISLRMPLSSLVSHDLVDPGASIALVFVTSDASLPPSERVKQLYSRFLSSEATPAAGGLIRRQFRAGTPYEGETLFLSPPEGRAFAARCQSGEFGSMELTCFAEIRHAGYDIQIQLARRDLALWERIVSRVKQIPAARAS